MGYRRKSKTYKLVFEGEFEGLEVTAKGLSVRKLLDMGELLDVDVAAPDSEDVKQIDELFSRFTDVLVSWNLEDENGEPIPTTKESLYEQDLSFVLAIIVNYITSVSGVSVDLGKESTSGEPSLEASMPMEQL